MIVSVRISIGDLEYAELDREISEARRDAFGLQFGIYETRLTPVQHHLFVSKNRAV